jgi:hypothetical protein
MNCACGLYVKGDNYKNVLINIYETELSILNFTRMKYNIRYYNVAKQYVIRHYPLTFPITFNTSNAS